MDKNPGDNFMKKLCFKQKPAIVFLSAKMKNWIQEFLNVVEAFPAEYGPTGGPQWTHGLLAFLQQHDASVRLEDVERWKKRHRWITARKDESVSSTNRDRPSNSTPADTSSRAHAPLATATWRDASVHSRGLNRREVLKRYDRYRDIIMELRDGFLEMPELRSGVVHLNPLTNMIARNMKRVMNAERREDAVFRDLLRQGIQQQVRGFKRDRSPTAASTPLADGLDSPF